MGELATRFVLGAAVGSFINVLALRYDPERFLIRRDMIVGRSRCPGCGVTLRWFELIPLLSFAFQRGRCLRCRRRISMQYPTAEILSGMIFAAVPVGWRMLLPVADRVSSPIIFVGDILWVSVFLLLLLMSLIDVRLKLIPDEIPIALVGVGVGMLFLTWSLSGSMLGSFAGPVAFMFGFRETAAANRIIAGLLALVFFGLICAFTRGSGMGMGDVKLAGALGFVFGWPDIAFLVFFAFVAGALAGVLAIAFKRKTPGSAVPFGPFLAFGAALVVFFGARILEAYFKILGA